VPPSSTSVLTSIHASPNPTLTGLRCSRQRQTRLMDRRCPTPIAHQIVAHQIVVCHAAATLKVMLPPTRRIATPPWCPISTTYGPGAKSCTRGDKSAPPPPVMAKLHLATSSGVGGEGMGASGGEYVFPFYYLMGRRTGSENGVCIIVRPLNKVLPPF
jgi:hypothetical protein